MEVRNRLRENKTYIFSGRNLPSPEIADIRYCVITFHARGRPIWNVKIYKDSIEGKRRLSLLDMQIAKMCNWIMIAYYILKHNIYKSDQ